MDIHFNANKVKYEVLNRMVDPVIRSMNIHNVNIFINLDDIFHRLHRPLVNAEFQIVGNNASKQLISNVLNIIAHYKQWGVRHGWNTKVIATYTSAINGGFKNELYIKNYRHKFKTINSNINSDYYFINESINQSKDLFSVMSQYIEGVYIIDSKFIEPSIIPLYISDNIFKSDYNIYISKDIYDLQYSVFDKWILIYPAGNNSKYIPKNDIWNHIKDKEKIENNYKLNYPMSLFPLSISIVGDKYRNIPRIKSIGWKTIFKNLDDIQNETDFKSDTSLQLILFDKLKSKIVTTDIINNNLAVIDIQSQCKRIGEIDKAFLMTQIKDVPDYENLLELNNRYFTKYPINIPFLSDQVLNSKYISKFGKNI